MILLLNNYFNRFSARSLFILFILKILKINFLPVQEIDAEFEKHEFLAKNKNQEKS